MALSPRDNDNYILVVKVIVIQKDDYLMSVQAI